MSLPVRRAIVTLTLSTAFVVACARDESANGSLALRTEVDTLGDTVVMRTLGPADAGVLQLVEEVRIGELEGEEAYTSGVQQLVRWRITPSITGAGAP